jgi:hypothetical protein
VAVVRAQGGGGWSALRTAVFMKPASPCKRKRHRQRTARALHCSPAKNTMLRAMFVEYRYFRPLKWPCVIKGRCSLR